MILPGTYANGFAPRDGQPLYPELWRGCVGAFNPGLGPTGLTLRDWSGRGNHGTLTNMVPGEDWVASQGRYALDFDGVDDSVQVPYSPVFDTVGGCRWSIEAWTLIRTGSATQTVISRGLTGSNRRDYILYAANYSGALFRFELQNSNGSEFPTIVSSAIDLNRWYHVAGTCTAAGVAVLYLNGVQIGTSTFRTDVAQTSRQVNIGFTQQATPGFPHAGLIDNVCIYNRALSLSEIRLLASRRGIAYEQAPRRRSSSAVQFNRRRRLLIGASS